MDVSNKTLAVLLIAAIVVSLGGTLLSSGGQKTGAVTTGTIDYEIDTNYVVNFSTATIDFGTGYVGVGEGPCIISTSGAPSGCQGSFSQPSPLVIDNVGNTNCKVEMEFDKSDTTFIGSSSDVDWMTTSISSSCTTPLPAGYAPIPSASTPFEICDSLNWQTNTLLEVDIRLTIDEADQGNGDQTMNVEITASAP